MGMAKCTECLHWDACLYLFKIVFDREPNLKGDRAEEKCPNFKYRTEYEKVVRCKNCKHWEKETKRCSEHPDDFNYGFEWFEFDEDDFCSYGERREGE